MILIPRFTDLYTKTPIVLGAKAWGEFKITMRDLNGRFLYETDWMPNLITNNGLDHVGDSPNYWGTWHVGSGTTPPAFTDTQLEALTGSGTTSPIQSSYGQLGAPDYICWGIRSQRFDAGQGTGTINELGIGPASNDLSIRALVTPGIVKNADQIMDITHKHYCQRDYVTSDLTGTIDISGVSYDYTLRAAEVNRVQTSTGFGAARSTGGVVCHGNIVAASVTGGSSTWRTSYIDGLNTTSSAYTPGSYQRQMNHSLGIDDGNHANGIRSIVWSDGMQSTLDFALGAYHRNPSYQCQFDGPGGISIPKDADKTFTISAISSWRRT
jgi:hypothetical protein